MKNERLIIKNTAILAAGRAVGMLSNLLFIIYFSRSFGAEVLGKYSLGMSIGGILTVCIALGLDTLLARDVSKDRARNDIYICNFLYVHVLMAVLVWIAILAWISNSGFPADTRIIVLLLGAYHVLFRISLLFRAQFQAHENMLHMAALNLVGKFSILLFGVLAIAIWKEPIVAVGVFPLTGLLMLLFALTISRTHYGFHLVPLDVGVVKDSLRFSMPLFLIVLLTQVYERIGIILLTSMSNETVTGIYAAPDRLIAVTHVGLLVYSNAIFPTLSRVIGQSREEMIALARRALRLLIVLLCPFVAALYLLSDEVITIIFGSEFGESVNVLRILSLSVVFDGLFVAVCQILIIAIHHNEVVKIQAIVYGVYIGISAVLIYFLGAAGLAYSKLIVSALLVTSVLRYASKLGVSLNIHKSLLIGVLASVLAVVLVEGANFLNAWLKALFAIMIFVISMFAVRELRLSDVLQFAELFRKSVPNK